MAFIALMIAASVSAESDEKEEETVALPHNFHIVTDRIFCGASPDSEIAFQALQSKGVKTVVSVDGAKPNAEMAKKHGLVYVHLPIPYGEVPIEVSAAVKDLLKETVGPIYVHCHHGKHRGPAVAAIAAMVEGEMDQKRALLYLEEAGTGKEYKGLWKDVGTFRGIPEGTKALPLVAAATVDDLAAAMADADRIYDRLAALLELELSKDAREESKHEATLLKESLHEMGRLPESKEFTEQMTQCESLAETLEAMLASAATNDELVAGLGKVKASCKACHREHRR